MWRQRHSVGRPSKDRTVVIRAPESVKVALDVTWRFRGLGEAWELGPKKKSNAGSVDDDGGEDEHA